MMSTLPILALAILAAAEDPFWNCTSVTWSGDRAVGGGGDLVVAGTPEGPRIEMRIEGLVRDLAGGDRWVAVAGDWGGTHLLRGPDLEPVATIPSEDAGLAVDLAGDLLAIAEGTAGVSFFALDRDAPRLLRRERLDGAEVVDVEIEGGALWAAASDGRVFRFGPQGDRSSWRIAGSPSLPPCLVATEAGIAACRGGRALLLDSGELVDVSGPIQGGEGPWLAAGPAGLLHWPDPSGRPRDPLAHDPHSVWDLELRGDRIATASGGGGLLIWHTPERGGAPRPLGSLRPVGHSRSSSPPVPADPVSAPWGPMLVEIGSVALPGNPVAVVVDEGRAYVAAQTRGLRAVDVSNPSRPTEIGAYDPVETPAYLNDLVLHQGHVIAACHALDDWYYFRVFDVHAGPDPLFIGGEESGSVFWIYGIDAGGDRLYLSGATGYGGNNDVLWTFDIREIAEPRSIGRYGFSASGTYWQSVAVDPDTGGALIYAVHSPWRLYGLDATVPSDPLHVDERWAALATDMEAEGDLLHQAPYFWSGPGYRVLAIDHTGNLDLEAEIDLPGGEMERLAVHDRTVAGVGQDHLWLLSVTDPEAPQLLADPVSIPGASDVFLDSDGYIYVTVAEEGLRIFRLIDPRR